MIAPDDPRHGTPWGYRQGCREDCCSVAHARRCKRYRSRAIAGGGTTLVDAAPTAQLLVDAATRMSLSAIGRHLGTSHAWVAKVIRGDIQRIATARADQIATTLGRHQPTDSSHVTVLGSTRRLRALHAIGYTWQRLSEETGMSLTGLKDIVYERWRVIEAANAASIATAYDLLSMTIPAGDTPYTRGAITAARLTSQRRGWPPPLAWDDIDDPAEQPSAWEYQPADRAELLADLVENGANATDACRRLRVGREALQKWCANNGQSHLYRTLARREAVARNQYTDLEREVS